MSKTEQECVSRDHLINIVSPVSTDKANKAQTTLCDLPLPEYERQRRLNE